MNRLQLELERLYFGQEDGPGDSGSAASRLLAAGALTRAMVLEVAAPAGWDALSRVWQGVQADLQLPAPAIAITGTDGYQLWFSLEQAIPGGRALSFLRLLQARYLGDVPRDRVRLYPSDASASARHVNPLPPALVAPGQWSAFLAPDLAALFADERWLDLAPSPQAQGELLARLQTTKASDLQRAMERLGPTQVPASGLPASHPDPITATQDAGEGHGPRAFLLSVMNDPAVDLALRIEAAKALLSAPGAERP
jgi:hypothetical protein